VKDILLLAPPACQACPAQLISPRQLNQAALGKALPQDPGPSLPSASSQADGSGLILARLPGRESISLHLSIAFNSFSLDFDSIKEVKPL
jgi:hypothetical protein